MKLLVDNTLQTYATPAVLSGFLAAKHDTRFMSTYDTFDSVNPDIYIADADYLSEAVFKNIEERPALKVVIVQKTNINTEHPYKHNVLNRFGNLYPWIIDAGHADLLNYKDSTFHKRYKSDIIMINDQPTSEILNTDHTEKVKDLKLKTLSELTNFHAIISVLSILGYDKESKQIENKLKEIL
jgi:hypothetical protein